MRDSKVQAFFEEFPFLRCLEKHIPEDVDVKVSRVEESLLEEKVREKLNLQIYLPAFNRITTLMCGYILMFNHTGRLLYSLGRTSRELPAVGFSKKKHIKHTVIFLLTAFVFLLLSWFCLLYKQNTLYLSLMFFAIIFLGATVGGINTYVTLWDSRYNETVGQAIKKLDQKSEGVFYIAVYDPCYHAPNTIPQRLILYKSPKGYSVQGWIKLNQEKIQEEFRVSVKEIDTEGEQIRLADAVHHAVKATRAEDGACSVCRKVSKGNFCPQCGATFLNPQQVLR